MLSFETFLFPSIFIPVIFGYSSKLNVKLSLSFFISSIFANAFNLKRFFIEVSKSFKEKILFIVSLSIVLVPTIFKF